MNAGPGARPDPRLNAYRDDLAARELAGRVAAARFVDPTPARVTAGRAALREAPDDDARQGSELLYGETLELYEADSGWAWVRNDTDGYVGYVRTGALSGPDAVPTHRVAALRTCLYAGPDIKQPPRDMLHMTSPVAVAEQHDGWCRLAGDDAGWLWARHLAPLKACAPDWIATARRFMGAPYVWGGRSSFGLDCSALVQLALSRAGIAAPRDSDMQEAGVGEPVAGGLEAAVPGDLLFYPGHVVILVGGGRILHANAHHMAVAEEKLSDFTTRTVDTVGPARTVRRPVSGGNPRG